MDKNKILDLEYALNTFEKINFDYCLASSLHGDYNKISYYKGYEACILSLKDYFKIKKNIDIIEAMRYI